MIDRREPGDLPVITDLFPLSPHSVAKARNDVLRPVLQGGDFSRFMDQEILRFITNPDLVLHLLEMANEISINQENPDHIVLGGLTAYRVFSEEASTRRGVLPVISQAVINSYGISELEGGGIAAHEPVRIPVFGVDFTEESLRLGAIARFKGENALLELLKEISEMDEDTAVPLSLGIIEVYGIFRTIREIDKLKKLL